MPGPLSYPGLWTEKRHNSNGAIPKRGRSGKTEWDHRHGTWLQHLRNQQEKSARKRGKR